VEEVVMGEMIYAYLGDWGDYFDKRYHTWGGSGDNCEIMTFYCEYPLLYTYDFEFALLFG